MVQSSRVDCDRFHEIAAWRRYQNDVLAGDINNGNLYHFKVNSTRDGLDFTTMALADRVADSGASFKKLF